MRSRFIFCLLAMYYIASANANSCPIKMNIQSVPCRILCQDYEGFNELKPKENGANCTMPGGKPGKCRDGECETK
uniref:Putative salivary kunitz domain protein n=1 Tax=Ixodes ricinus TaxID=34613 RepID=A0A0K8RF67_IXORI